MKALASIFLPLLLGACAGRAPVTQNSGDTACPDISGSYCAHGQQWTKGDTELTDAYLPYYLGVERSQWQEADRVDIEGVVDGALKLALRAGTKELAAAEIREPDLVCGSGRVALQMAAIPWGGAGPILALGASSGWRLLQQSTDGSLRVEEQRHETGTVFLVLPLYLNGSSYLRFRPYTHDGCSLP